MHSSDPVVEKDLILVHIDNKPAFFARVEEFVADHKPRWWHVKLLILQVPPVVTTWILRKEQINGEPFTMGGTPVRIEKVLVPEETHTSEEDHGEAEPEQPDEEPKQGKARILSLGSDKKE
ncbi:MAG TPA: hypothetical protein ENJ29_03165 [Bacteroidetes bacterium]|nr:hypothetical protein [Bacteroidota bacterium]